MHTLVCVHAHWHARACVVPSLKDGSFLSMTTVRLTSALRERKAECSGSWEEGHVQVTERNRVGGKVSGRVETCPELLKRGAARVIPGRPSGDGWREAELRLEIQGRG